MPAALRTILIAAVVVLAGCNTLGVLATPATGPLVTITTRGGECVGGACGGSVILERDGSVHAAAKPPNGLGQVPPEAMATLTAALAATDFTALKSRPFTGVCPVAFDGQELIFEFSVGGTTQRIASCEVDINWGHPLFVAVGVALGQWVSMPLT